MPLAMKIVRREPEIYGLAGAKLHKNARSKLLSFSFLLAYSKKCRKFASKPA